MSNVWSNELELTFIECFRAEPVLWDINLKDYKNKLKTHDAWMRISTVMEIPIDELKKKKDSLMSSYRSYKGKVKKSVQSGAGADEIYQPIWFAYEAMDAFLGDTLKCKKSMNTERGIKEPKEVNLEAIKENVEEMNENRSQSINTQKDSDQTIHRRKISSEVVDAGNVVKDALITFKSTLKRNPLQPIQQDDDCDLYGKLLANKLRKLSEKNRLKLMHDIDGMYLQYQFDDPLVMTPSPPHFYEPRTGTSSSTHSEPPFHYGQANQNTYYQNRQVISAPPSNIIIQSNRLIRTPDYPVLHLPENQDANTSDHNNDIVQTAFDLS
nr:uncharacterized protein LOC110373991 [Helicoverpa armigera]XP_049692901.1 uncharacterized protein LOC110373513 [Helicoverpa armigera]XP_049695498.1 uncharacterized protein LOC126054322 [Helicoverpa armigera]XP_049701618.1 uncharacterized protein LOC126055626 [Helicoverpa armigera]XP_049701770.1 uncharacterized protein LOC126055649 [Helicoverpa armigera]XP_049704633.1 uncharacterized protein LOC126056258 [Helicoverpa armigera]XP_049705200.1 uncharacterized protein LOC126056410 [Helicoverpa 